MKATRIVAAAALAIILASACDTGIGYQTVQQETSQASSSVFKQTSVKDAVAFDGKYYVPLVAIYARGSSNGSDDVAKGWASVKLDCFDLASTDAYTTWGLAATPTKLYAALQEGTVTSAKRGIFTLGTGSSATWTAESFAFGTADSSTAIVSALYSVNDQLFAVVASSTASSATYGLWHLSAANTFTSTGITSVTFIPKGAYVNGEYFFAAKAASADTASTIYHGSTPATLKDATFAPNAASFVSSMAAASGSGFDYLALGLASGDVELRDAASPYSLVGTKTATAGSSNPVTSLIALSSGSNTVLLAGSFMTSSDSKAGYKEALVTSGNLGAFVTGSDSSAIVAKNSLGVDSYASTVAAVPVVNFAVAAEGSGTRLFACTASASVNYTGLWSNYYNGSAWGGWVSE